MKSTFIKLLIIIFFSGIGFSSCEEEELLPFEANFVEWNCYNNRLTRLSVIIQNNTDKTIYYLKFRLELRKDGKNVSSDLYEFGNKTNKDYWFVEPKDATQSPWVSCNIPYYETESDKYEWVITEVIEYLTY